MVKRDEEFHFGNCYVIRFFQSGFVELAVLGLVTVECCSALAGSWTGGSHSDLQNALCHQAVSFVCSGCSCNYLTLVII